MIKKRSYLLLELLIAFSLATLLLSPLVQPLFYFLKAESSFSDSVHLRRRADLSFADIYAQLYRNNLKNREFGKEAPQNFDAEQATIAEGQGASEHQNSEAKPTEPKPDSLGCFGIYSQRIDLKALPKEKGEKLLYRTDTALHFKEQIFIKLKGKKIDKKQHTHYLYEVKIVYTPLHSSSKKTYFSYHVYTENDAKTESV